MKARKPGYQEKQQTAVRETIVALRAHGSPAAVTLADALEGRLRAMPEEAATCARGRGDGKVIPLGSGTVRRTDGFLAYCLENLALLDLIDLARATLTEDPDLRHLAVHLRHGGTRVEPLN